MTRNGNAATSWRFAPSGMERVYAKSMEIVGVSEALAPSSRNCLFA
jgi:hypothetical protein